MAHIVDSGNGHDDDGPDRGDEKSEVPRQRIWIERGMIVEVTPRLWGEELDATIKHRR